MDKREFRTFYEEHIDRVYRYLFYRVKHKEIAEDLTSDVFMKALEHFEKYDPERSKTSWIMTIAHNRLANYFRDKKPQTDIEPLAFSLPGEDLRVTVNKKDAEWTIAKYLIKLTERERTLIEQKYLLSMSYKEMAELDEKSANALKVETHRAMVRLKKIAQE